MSDSCGAYVRNKSRAIAKLTIFLKIKLWNDECEVYAGMHLLQPMFQNITRLLMQFCCSQAVSRASLRICNYANSKFKRWRQVSVCYIYDDDYRYS